MEGNPELCHAIGHSADDRRGIRAWPEEPPANHQGIIAAARGHVAPGRSGGSVAPGFAVGPAMGGRVATRSPSKEGAPSGRGSGSGVLTGTNRHVNLTLRRFGNGRSKIYPPLLCRHISAGHTSRSNLALMAAIDARARRETCSTTAASQRHAAEPLRGAGGLRGGRRRCHSSESRGQT